MKVNRQFTPQRKLLHWRALFFIGFLTLVVFILPSAGIGAELILQQDSGSSVINTSLTLTATLTDGDNPVYPANVQFAVSGANSARVRAATASDGTASFSYEGYHEGTDTITVITPIGSQSVTHEWLAEAPQDIAMEITAESICIDFSRAKRVPCIDLDNQLAAIEGNDRDGSKKVRSAFHRWRRQSTRLLTLLVKVPEGLEAAEVDMGLFKLCDPDSEACVECERSRVKDADRDGADDLLLRFWIPEMVHDGVLHENSAELLLTGKTVDERNIVASLPVHMVKYKSIGDWTKRWKEMWRKHRQSMNDWKYRSPKKGR